MKLSSYATKLSRPPKETLEAASLRPGTPSTLQSSTGSSTQKDQEIAVLKRWLAICPKARRNGSGIAERLAKLEAA